MAFDDDYYDDGSSRSGGSHGARQESNGKTSGFDTTLISKDNRFIGMQLSPDVARQARMFFNVGLDWTRKQAERIGIPLAESFAKNVLGHNAHEAKHFGGKAGDVIGYGIILSDQLANIGQNFYSSAQSMNDLRLAVKPLAKAGSSRASTAPLSGDNEVVANVRAKINGIFWQRLVQTVTSTIAVGPTLYSKFNEQKVLNAERDKIRRYEEARASKDPKALAKFYEEEMGLSGIKLVAGHEEEALDGIIESHRKLYNEKFKKFKTEHESEIRKEVRDLIKITDENVHDKLHILERYGLYTSTLRDEIKGGDKKAIEDAIKKFEKNYSKQLKKLEEKMLRAKFVRQHGAFDHDDLEYYTLGKDRYSSRNQQTPPTLQDELRKKFEKFEEALHKAEDEKKTAIKNQGKGESALDIGTMGASLVSTIGAEFATKMMGGKALEEFEKPIALDRILHLRRSLEDIKGEPPETIHPAKGSSEHDMGYVRYVHEVFQQHQKDCKRPEIGERFIERFEKARWSDSAIFQVADSELNPYEFAVKTIAQRIKTGRMDAIALIELVGDKHRKIVHTDGRTFGPVRTGDEEASKKAITALIDEKTAILHSGQKHTDEEVNEKLGNFVFGVADLKHVLTSKDVDAQQRAFIFTLFSDVVGSDEKLCAKLGISNERCHQLRNESKERFTAMLDGAVEVLADVIENEPEKLDKQLKLTDKQKELILAVAGRAKEQGKFAGDVVENAKEREDVEAVVADSMMTLAKEPAEKDEEGKPQGFWQKVVAAARKTKQPKEKDEGFAGGEEQKSHRKKSHASRRSREEMDDGFSSGRADESETFPPGQEMDERPSHSDRLGGHKGRHKFSPIDHLGDKPPHDESGIRGI